MVLSNGKRTADIAYEVARQEVEKLTAALQRVHEQRPISEDQSENRNTRARKPELVSNIR
jgi:hypothetical protein